MNEKLILEIAGQQAAGIFEGKGSTGVYMKSLYI